MTVDNKVFKDSVSRRAFLSTAAMGASSLAFGLKTPAIAQSVPLKVGVMLPFSGTFAKLGQFIERGFQLYVDEKSGALGGRRIEFVRLDDESKPETATDNINRLVGRDKVDVVLGTVHSGVAMAMVKVARDTGVPLIIPNAGADEATGPLCASNIFRTSFSNWQVSQPMGKVMFDEGYRNVVTITWRYAAGTQMTKGFKEGFEKAGGKIVEDLTLPFPEVEFQALITRIAQLKPDAVFAFFAGGGAVKFVTDYAAAGLKGKIPLYGTGFLTDGTLPAQGAAAEGIRTTLHYADDLDTPSNRRFLQNFKTKTGEDGDIYAVQGYDSAALLEAGLVAAGGDIQARDKVFGAMAMAQIDSPRGPLSFSVAHNPVQNIYLREVRNGENVLVSTAGSAVADPARGCKMG
ncbi:ABC transporter permease [Rhizobium sp. Root149]|uniref:ABC transporter substrate-binding protein n=1 Tax=Rhizobium sp. Root149 TaxID=1736473 RepID=UPI0007139C50|nr:ABC transporter substrate-binding protein [Rhizobium sp. Root149]KQZ46676.1 ABC transporter permease [Rhizobium sp. Root149]